MAPKKSAGGAAAPILTPEEPPTDGPIPPIPSQQIASTSQTEIHPALLSILNELRNDIREIKAGQSRFESRLSLLERPVEQPPAVSVPRSACTPLCYTSGQRHSWPDARRRSPRSIDTTA